MQKYFYLVLLTIGLLWFQSGLGKLFEGNFPQALNQTLMHFAEDNPYPWFKEVLYAISIPYAVTFGYMVMIGEILSGISILISSILLLLRKTYTMIQMLLLEGLLIGAVLNLIFWFASGHLSPASDSLNLLMFAIQIIGIIFVIHLLNSSHNKIDL